MLKQGLHDHIKNIVYLSDEQMDLALSFFKPSTHPKFELLVREGEVGKYMNFIVKGCIRIYLVREDG